MRRLGTTQGLVMNGNGAQGMFVPQARSTSNGLSSFNALKLVEMLHLADLHDY
jgi:hypothetical protein